MWSPRNGERAQPKNFKTEAVIKLQKSLNPHLLQRVGKCSLLWERHSTSKNPQKMEYFLQPLKSTFLHLMFQARVFCPTGKRVHCCPCLPLTALQQRVWTSYKPSRHRQRSTRCPSSPTSSKKGSPIFVIRGWKKSHFWRAHCSLSVSLLIYFTA